MSHFLRDTWDTFHAVAVMIRSFFVKWFLPLHGNDDEDEEEERERWTWDDDDAQEAELIADTVPRQIEYSEAFPPPETEEEEGRQSEPVAEDAASDVQEYTEEEEYTDGDEDTLEDVEEEQQDDADRD